MKTIMITGATRGLGLAMTRALDEVEDIELVLAVRDIEAGEAVARTLRRPARVVSVDTGSLVAIRRLTSSWTEPLHALVNNAGLQFSGPTSFTQEGIETTLAVNHLGPLQLTLDLLPYLKGGRVIGIGSGTHNPENRTAARFGFRGARFTSIEALARGEMEAETDAQRGLDRYATSKLLAMVTAMELARRYPGTCFATFDPGMMPGTGLVRTGPWYVRAAWSSVLRWVAPLLDDTSTPARSAVAAREILFKSSLPSGEVYDHEGQPSRRVWTPSRDPEVGRRVLDESLAFLAAKSLDTATRAS